MSTEAPNPFAPDYDPVAEEIEGVAKAEYQRGRLEGARIVRDAWVDSIAKGRDAAIQQRNLLPSTPDIGQIAELFATECISWALREAFKDIPKDDDELRKLIEGEG